MSKALNLPASPAEPDLRVSFAPDQDFATAIAAALIILRREGVVVLDDLVDPALIAQCLHEISATYPDMSKVDRERNYGPYAGRHTMPVVVRGLLADPAILVPKAVAKIATELLGAMFKVDSIGLLVAVPGAPDQARHADATLYHEARIDQLVPPFALAFSLPLVAMDEVSGTTAFWRGSHRKQPGGEPHDFAPVVPPGSAVLWDYRIHHGGLANRGSAPRPVVFAALAREWWIDIDPPGATRYDKLLVDRAVHAALKPARQRRLSRAKLVD